MFFVPKTIWNMEISVSMIDQIVNIRFQTTIKVTSAETVPHKVNLVISLITPYTHLLVSPYMSLSSNYLASL